MKRHALLFCFAVLLQGQPASAARALQLSLEACDRLSRVEVQRLAELELATVGGGESNAGDAEAAVVCQGDEARITAREPSSGRALSRSLLLPSALLDQDRVVAIAVAQLVRALDWLPSQPVAPAATVAPQAIAPRAAAEPPHPSARVQLEAVAGLRVRDSEQSLVGRRIALGSSLRVSPRWALGATIAFENGKTERAAGDVRANLLAGAVRLTLEPWGARRFGMLARAEVGLAHLSLRGVNALPGLRTAEISGMGIDAALGAGPLLRTGPFAIAVLGQAGAAYFGGEALVTAAAPINLDGGWLGAELAVGVEL